MQIKEIKLSPEYPNAILRAYLPYNNDTEADGILICPGGGYVYCSPREGEPVALRYAAKGFHAFKILRNLYLTRRVSSYRDRKIVRLHSASVITHADKGNSAVLNFNRDSRSSGIY